MRAFVTTIVIAGVTLACKPTFAAPADDADALAHLDRGVAAYRARDFALAERELEQAHQLAPDRPNPFRWLALVEAELGECPAALVNIESFMSRVPAGDPRVAELVQLRERCVLEIHAQRKDSVATPVPLPPPPPITTPITHRWWFWTAVGVVAAAAAGATYEVMRDHGPAQLPPITCGATGCVP
jgi:hypothetical protein